MDLTPQEEQELAELEELERLEAELGAAGEAPTELGAALEGVGQTATLGYLPQIEAGMQKYIADPLARMLHNEATDPRTGKPISAEQAIPEKSYIDWRDQNISRHEAQAEEHPGYSLAGKAAGALLTAPITGAANSMRAGAAVGAAQGALYNPGDEQGEMSGLQLAERIPGGLAGMLGGGIGGGIAGWFNRARQVKPMLRAVQDPAKVQDLADGQIKAGVKQMNERYINPRNDKLTKLLQGEPGMSRLETNSAELAAQHAGIPKLPAELPKEGAHVVKQLLDEVAGYAKSQSASDASAVSRNELARGGANFLRKQENAVPGAKPLNQEMSEALRLRGLLQQRGKRPIAAVTSKNMDRLADMQKFDKLAGTNLVDFGEKLNRARGLAPNSSNWSKPMMWLQETRKLGERKLINASPALEPITRLGSELSLKALLESVRKK